MRYTPRVHLDLHRHLGWLSLAFTAAHLISLWADTYTTFGPVEFLVPMSSTWRPGAVTWGVVATYLLIVIQVTSWGMRRLPRKVWHAVHYLSLPMLVTGTVHGILAGADWSTRAVDLGLVAGLSSVVWLATFRVLSPGKANANDPRLAAARAARAGQVAQSALAGRPLPAPTGEPLAVNAPL